MGIRTVEQGNRRALWQYVSFTICYFDSKSAIPGLSDYVPRQDNNQYVISYRELDDFMLYL